MHINIGRRCYIKTNKDLAILQNLIDVHDHYPGYKITFTIYATLPNPNLKTKLLEILSHAKQNYEIIEEDLTAQKVFYRHLFQENSGINVMADLDQFPLQKEIHLKKLLELATKLKKQGQLYANGIRMGQVILGKNEKASKIRVAHEIFLSALTRVFKDPQEHHKVLSPYNLYGEIVSGCYFINPQSRYFQELKEQINNHAYLLEGHTFAAEYFTALYCGLHNAVTTGHVISTPNNYQDIREEDELEKVSQRITRATGLLLTTSIKQELRQALSDVKLKNEMRMQFEEEIITILYGSMGKAIQQI